MTDLFGPLDVEPTTMMTGNFYSWTVPDDYASATYTMAYSFIQGGVARALAGTFTNGLWTFTAASAFTSQFAVGPAIADLNVTRISDSARVTLRSLSLNFFTSLAERRSHAAIMVQKIESIMAGRADSDVDSYTIKSRSITKMSIKELTEWREYYMAELGRQPDPFTGKPKGANTIKVGFI
jgi:hypothetical protein